MATIIPKTEAERNQMIANAPLNVAIRNNPQLLQAIAAKQPTKVKVVDSAGTEWTVNVDANGKVTASSGHPIRNSLIGLGAGLGGIAAGGALAGGSAAATPAATASGGGAAADAGLDAALVDSAATTAPISGAAGTGSIWSRIAPSLISLGGTVAGGILGSHAAGKAADQQAAAAQQALDFQKQVFATNQANQQPFIQVGTGAAGRLNALMGGGALNVGSAPSSSAPMTASRNPVVAAQGMTPLDPAQNGGWTGIMPNSQIQPTVRLQAPDGSIQAVPAAQAAHFIAQGAQRIG